MRSRHNEEMRRIAVIDIGSNSVRLVIYDGLSRSPMQLFNEKVLCGLGRSLGETGALDVEGRRMALDSLTRFASLLDAIGIRDADVLPVATAAVREASDGPDFIDAVRDLCGLDIQLISGEEEARLSATGVISTRIHADGFMGDLGGGSLEMVCIDDGVAGEQISLPVGSLRLMAMGGGISGISREIDAAFDTVPFMDQMRGKTFYAVGGAWRTIGKIHMAYHDHPIRIIDNYRLSAGEAQDFARMIARQSRASLERMSHISGRRLDVLPAAAQCMSRLIDAAQPADICFSQGGLREGLLFDRLDDEMRRDDPLIAACRSIARSTGRFGDSKILTAWTAPLYPGEDEETRRLRQAACYMSDFGWSEHDNYRAEHVFYRVLRLSVPGLEHHWRAFLALALYIRHGGSIDDALVSAARGLLSDVMQTKAAVIGEALRLAFTMTGGALKLLENTRMKIEDGKIVIEVPEGSAMFGGDRLEARIDALGEAAGCKAKLVEVPSGARTAAGM